MTVNVKYYMLEQISVRNTHCFLWEMRMLLKVYRKIWNCLAHIIMSYNIIRGYALHIALCDIKYFMILRLHNNLILKNSSRSVLQQKCKSKHNRDFPWVRSVQMLFWSRRMSADNYRVYWFIIFEVYDVCDDKKKKKIEGTYIYCFVF